MYKSAMEKWLDKTEIVLTGPFSSSSNQNYVGTKFSCLKYDLQCTYIEYELPLDKTYNTQYFNVCATSKDSGQSVCASTHYIKQTSWIARSPQKVHTV